MKKTITSICALFLLVFTWQFTNAQTTTTITYSSSALCTASNCCNTFNQSSNTVVNGRTHQAVSGGCTFDGTNIIMPAVKDIPNNIDKGTAFAIAYSFTANNDYTISVNAFRRTNSGNSTSFPNLTLGLYSALPSTATTNPTACGAVSEYIYATGNPQIYTTGVPSKNPAVFSTGSFSVSSTKNYLTVVSSDPFSVSSVSLYITEITITETPKVTFTLSPGTVSKTCGTALSQTFTVTNVYSTPGVTSYTWNLGASNNWYYNGNPAPASFTAGSSITLTSNACDPFPSNVSATVAIGAANYNTNVATISPANPSLLISGDETLCTGFKNYIINNIPCNGTVSWSLYQSVAGIATLSTNGNQATVTKSGNGYTELNATVTLPCGAPFALQPKPIDVGVPDGTNYSISGPSMLCVNQSATYSTIQYGNVNYTWTNSGFMSGSGTGPSVYAVAPPLGGSGTLWLNVSNTCGSIANPVVYFVSFNALCRVQSQFTITPNPAKSSVMVNMDQNKNVAANGGISLIYKIKITDPTGIVKKIEEFNAGLISAKVSIAHLLPGNYILSVYDGNHWQSKTLIVQ